MLQKKNNMTFNNFNLNLSNLNYQYYYCKQLIVIMQQFKTKFHVNLTKIKFNQHLPDKISRRHQTVGNDEMRLAEEQSSLSLQEIKLQKIQHLVKSKQFLTKQKTYESIRYISNQEKKSETTNDRSKLELNQQLLQILSEQNKNLKQQNKLLYERVKLLQKKIKDSLQQCKSQILSLIKQKQLLEQNILDFSGLIKYKLQPYTQKLMSYIVQIQQQNTKFLNIINLTIMNNKNKYQSDLSIEQKLEYANKDLSSMLYNKYDKESIILGINTKKYINSIQQRICLTEKQSLNS